MCVYVGGEVEYPTYERIQDHTEGVTVTFDKDVISYSDLLHVFMSKASLTLPCSSSRQYMTGVWFHTLEQRRVCEQMFREYEKRHGVDIKVHTSEITKAGIYRAEEYHQRYFEKHGGW